MQSYIFFYIYTNFYNIFHNIFFNEKISVPLQDCLKHARQTQQTINQQIANNAMNICTINEAKHLPQGTAVSVGMFDGVHRGHQKVLRSLGVFAETLGTDAMAITFDRHPRLVLAAQDNAFHLLNTNDERFGLIRNCGIQNLLIIPFTPQVAALSACQFVQKYLVETLGIKGLLLGYDNMFGNKQNNDFEQIPALAQKCRFAIANEGSVSENGIQISSTQIRKALSNGNIALANSMLGYTYNMRGTVVKGRQVGRTLHFPTANIHCSDPLKMLPADGVYCVSITIDNQPFEAMCNIGTQPTFDSLNRTIEVHVFDFQQDIYDKEVTLCFLEKIRDIQRFDSVENLVNQLVADKQKCLQFFEQKREKL